MIWRGYCDYVYYTCMRCNRKHPIELMSWDNGLLVCNERCKDKAIMGSDSFAWARAAAQNRNELVPDPKLIHPVDPTTQIGTLPASAGVYS